MLDIPNDTCMCIEHPGMARGGISDPVLQRQTSNVQAQPSRLSIREMIVRGDVAVDALRCRSKMLDVPVKLAGKDCR